MKMGKKTKQKIISIALIAAFLLSPVTCLWAEDYPAGFLAPGYREYLSQKKIDGYYVDVFTRIDLRQRERVSKRNQLEDILGYSYQTAPVSANGILATEYQHKYNSEDLRRDILKQRQEREKAASVNIEGGFTYIPYSDGKIEYFKDGLVIRIENERVVDEFGNVSLKNTYNMQYNDKRLLIAYDANLADSLGNVTKLSWYGAKYTEDSLFYGSAQTNANKNLTEYYLKEIDPAGNERTTHWQALSYEGKLLRAFSQTIEDKLYGNVSFTRSQIQYAGSDPTQATSYHEEGTGTDNLNYSLDRSNITYNDKGQIIGYHEEIYTTQLDGKRIKTIVDAQFKYTNPLSQFGADVDPDPDRLFETIITTTTENPDSSFKTDTTTTTYNYGPNGRLISTTAESQFNGREVKWYEYRDAAGHVLSRNTDEDGEFVDYSYVDPETGETVTVEESEVTATLKDGKEYKGTQVSEVQYEALFGKPMAKQAHYVTTYYRTEDNAVIRVEDSTITYENGLVNNLPKVLSTQEHTSITSPLLDPDGTHANIQDIQTTYTYDAQGNLSGAAGSGTGSGWEYASERGWSAKYTSAITIEYAVILGKAVRKAYEERRVSEYENNSDNQETEDADDTEEAEDTEDEENTVETETLPVSTSKNTTINITYEYNEYGVLTSSTEETTTETTTTVEENGEEQTTTSTTISTTTNTYKGGLLKAVSISGTSSTTSTDGSSSDTAFWTNYEYSDEGYLLGVSGHEESSGDRGTNDDGDELGTFESSTVDYYIIQDGQALKVSSIVTGTNFDPDEEEESTFTETVTYEYELIGENWELIKESRHSETEQENGASTTIDKVKIYQRDANGLITGITQTASGETIAVGGNETKTYPMQNYQAEFAFDPELGWYLKKESWKWQDTSSPQDDEEEDEEENEDGNGKDNAGDED
jgi:hypothetical protein